MRSPGTMLKHLIGAVLMLAAPLEGAVAASVNWKWSFTVTGILPVLGL